MYSNLIKIGIELLINLVLILDQTCLSMVEDNKAMLKEVAREVDREMTLLRREVLESQIAMLKREA